MMLYRPKPPQPYWRWRFVWFKRLGDYIAILEWLKVRYEESEDGHRWTFTWHNRDLDGEPYFIETGDVPAF